MKVPPNGLSEVSRKWLQYQKESVNQVLKAAMAINAQVLTEMEVPEAYIESLPKVITENDSPTIFTIVSESMWFLVQYQMQYTFHMITLSCNKLSSSSLWSTFAHLCP